SAYFLRQIIVDAIRLTLFGIEEGLSEGWRKGLIAFIVVGLTLFSLPTVLNIVACTKVRKLKLGFPRNLAIFNAIVKGITITEPLYNMFVLEKLTPIASMYLLDVVLDVLSLISASVVAASLHKLKKCVNKTNIESAKFTFKQPSHQPPKQLYVS